MWVALRYELLRFSPRSCRFVHLDEINFSSSMVTSFTAKSAWLDLCDLIWGRASVVSSLSWLHCSSPFLFVYVCVWGCCHVRELTLRIALAWGATRGQCENSALVSVWSLKCWLFFSDFQVNPRGLLFWASVNPRVCCAFHCMLLSRGLRAVCIVKILLEFLYDLLNPHWSLKWFLIS